MRTLVLGLLIADRVQTQELRHLVAQSRILLLASANARRIRLELAREICVRQDETKPIISNDMELNGTTGR